MVPLSFENSQLLTERKVFKDQVSFALEYESEQSQDELGKDFQGCFLPNITIELILNRYSGSLHESLKLKKFEFLSRTGVSIQVYIPTSVRGCMTGVEPVRSEHTEVSHAHPGMEGGASSARFRGNPD